MSELICYLVLEYNSWRDFSQKIDKKLPRELKEKLGSGFCVIYSDENIALKNSNGNPIVKLKATLNFEKEEE